MFKITSRTFAYENPPDYNAFLFVADVMRKQCRATTINSGSSGACRTNLCFANIVFVQIRMGRSPKGGAGSATLERL